jgi:hypothetical protein
MPVLLISRCGGPSEPRFQILAFGVFWRRLAVLHSGPPFPRPISRSRLSTNLVACPSTMPTSTLHRQADLNGGITITSAKLLATLAVGRGRSGDGVIKPDRQRSTAPERCIGSRPVPDLVGPWYRSARPAQASRFSNRRVWVARLRGFRTSGLRCPSRAQASLRDRHWRPYRDRIRSMRRNNLCCVPAADCTRHRRDGEFIPSVVPQRTSPRQLATLKQKPSVTQSPNLSHEF